MPIEIACGNCGNTFGVEAQWAGLVVECPFCQTAVQVPEEVAQLAEVAVHPENPDFQGIGPVSEPQEPVAIKTGPAETSSTKGEQSKSSGLNGSQSPRAETRPPTNSQGRTGTPASATKKSPDSPKTKPQRSKPQRSKPPVTPPTIEAEILPETPQAASPSSDEATGEPLGTTTTPPPLPIPRWTTPPTVGWLADNVDGNLGQVKVVVKVGTTTIQYQGERVVLRDQPAVRQWYGTVMFFLSVITLALILTGLYFLYRA